MQKSQSSTPAPSLPADPRPRHIHPHHKVLPPEFQTTPEGRATAERAHNPPPATPFAAAPDLTLASTLALPHSALRIPVLGLGVWASPAHVTATTVATALRAGYRHVDTAQLYGNEAAVGEGLRAAGVPRAEVFATTKIRTHSGDAERDYRRCVESVEKIDPGEGGYVDLFLVHAANVGAGGRRALWGVMERLLKDGRAKSIGVSNWARRHIEEIKEGASVWPPQVNQIEVRCSDPKQMHGYSHGSQLHPWCQQREVVQYCREHGIVVEAYSPLVRMQKAQDPTLVRVAENVGKSTAQVLIRYCLQKGWVPLPKSDKEERIKGNADVFDWTIGEQDMKALDALGDQGDDGIVVAVENLDERYG